MDCYEKSIIPVIEANYENFTAAEKNIADFFISNNENIDFSANVISEKLFVSEAALTRFSKKCGYRGYREFIYQYKNTFVVKHKNIATNIKSVLDTYQILINKAYNLINENQIKTINDYLKKAKRVFVCGIGSSGFVANEVALRFMRVGMNINSINNGDEMRMQTVFQNETNVVIGISLSANKKDILYFLSESHKKGAKTVLFTANQNKKFSEFCDEVVIVPSQEHLDYGNTVSPQFPVLLIMDIIYSYYVNQDRRIKESIHYTTLKALENEE